MDRISQKTERDHDEGLVRVMMVIRKQTAVAEIR